jgi:hypothetical protein
MQDFEVPYQLVSGSGEPQIINLDSFMYIAYNHFKSLPFHYVTIQRIHSTIPVYVVEGNCSYLQIVCMSYVQATFKVP